MTSRRRAFAALALVGRAVSHGRAAVATTVAPRPPHPPPCPRPDIRAHPFGAHDEPEPGSLPDFPYQDYAYTLETRCFCANIDQKYRIAVAGGEVTRVTWATAGDGHEVGEPVADDYLRLTIQDIIDQGNDPKAAQVDVEWPADQEYPTSVYVDQDKMIADEEVTYVISEVVTA